MQHFGDDAEINILERKMAKKLIEHWGRHIGIQSFPDSLLTVEFPVVAVDFEKKTCTRMLVYKNYEICEFVFPGEMENFFSNQRVNYLRRVKNVVRLFLKVIVETAKKEIDAWP